MNDNDFVSLWLSSFSLLSALNLPFNRIYFLKMTNAVQESLKWITKNRIMFQNCTCLRLKNWILQLMTGLKGLIILIHHARSRPPIRTDAFQCAEIWSFQLWACVALKHVDGEACGSPRITLFLRKNVAVEFFMSFFFFFLRPWAPKINSTHRHCFRVEAEISQRHISKSGLIKPKLCMWLNTIRAVFLAL